ncbi:MAG: glutamate--cysteine ligase, partial [Chlamydiia bacterium]|nr:glutamate--cysteine ligase [Chlamydiia bacterium]
MNKRYAALENNLPLLKESRHGLEIETLRIDSEGRISQKDHPKPLGAKLTHPHISTDFGEAQLELIAPPLKREAALVSYIEKLKAFIHLKNPDELLWPFSAPCSLKAHEEVRIARFGSSNAGWEKEVYREGLSNRFDRRMQALSGVHYNFSLTPAFWEVLGDPSEGYLHIVRNFMRHGWLLTYLFGASPYLENVSAPFATSLRMSEYGYFSKVQQQMRISFNSLEKYLEDLSLALETPSLDFLKIGTYKEGKWKQLNPNILQIEAEHYSRIRPKPSKESPLRPLHSLQKEGITYVEVRALDLQPFANGSISAECLRFLHAFLLFCLIEESPPLSIEEELKLAAQENRIALEGRSPAMRPFVAEGAKILDKVQEAAALLDRAWGGSNYKKSVEAQRPLIGDPEKTPSARIVRERGENSFQEYALQKARGMKFVTLTPKEIHRFEQMAQKSWEALEELEWRDDFILPGFEDLHPSTQCLLREAMRRGVSIETLDHKAHFFRLRRGAVTQDIKDANMTAKDNLISYFKMENKAVTKTLLEQAGIKTPQGRLCYTPEEALANTNSRY